MFKHIFVIISLSLLTQACAPKAQYSYNDSYTHHTDFVHCVPSEMNNKGRC